MGSNDDIMHGFVRKELRKLYPSVDGWQIKPAAKTVGAKQGFVVWRRILGRTEGAHVLVSFDRIVAPGTGDILSDMSRTDPIPALANPKKILVVPRGTDTASVPREVEILPMQNFGWEDKELVWLKRRAQINEKAAATKSS